MVANSCGPFDALIARSDQLTPDESAELAAHLAGCASCRELARAVKPVEDAALAATGTSETMLSGDGSAGGPVPEATSDRYRIVGEVGRGGIGRVLRALDQVLDRPVALKELFTASDGARRRFIREALITARLQHPSIVPVYDAGHLGDRSPFYAMKLVEGRPLDRSIAEASTLARRLALLPSVLAVADAMAYAHSERIIHRDLKPANVLVGKYGETIVIDWGLAKDLAIDDTDAPDAGPYRTATLDRTVAGVVMGTPAYMAPEQAAGEPLDERADVYALGAILYHVVSGAIPHEGTTLEEMIHRVTSGDVRPLTEREPDVPRDLAAIVTKAMALEPSARYANAQGFADDLRRFLDGQLVGSHSYGTGELLRRWLGRHRGAVMVALAALAVVAVVGIASVVRVVRARDQAAEAAAVATRERNTATEALTEMLQEQGRQELLAGRPARAAAYLGEAYARSHDPSVALRSLLADSMRLVEAQRMSFDGDVLGPTVFSSDGSRLLTTSGSVAEVRDATTGGVITTLQGDTVGLMSASFSPDNARIAATDIDNVRVWDARSGALVATLDHRPGISAPVFSPDGTRIVTLGGEGSIKLWDASSSRFLALVGHGANVQSAAFSADGRRVVTASDDGTAKIWDTSSMKLVFSLEGHHDRVASARFSPDGTQVVTASADGTARVWDAKTGRVVASLEGHSGPVRSAAFSRDGSRIVTASYDHTAKLWDARTGKLEVSLDGHAAQVNSAELAPDGSIVVTASDDHTAKLWDSRGGGVLASFEGHRDGVSLAMFSPDGKRVLTAGVDGIAKVWDARPSKLRMSLAGVGAAAPDGATAVTFAKGDHGAKLWDLRTGKLIGSLDGHRTDIVLVGFDSAGARVTTVSLDQRAKLWDTRTGKLVVSLDDNVAVAELSPDGARMVTGGVHGTRLWDATTGTAIATLDTDDERIDDRSLSAAFSADSQRVVTTTGQKHATIWRADTGTMVTRLDGRSRFHGAVFSRDGARVITAGRAAWIFDARTGKLVTWLDGHTRDVESAAFSPDGTRVVTASSDHTAKLWDAQTGKLAASLEGHTDDVRHAAFSSDGARVVTASDDHTAKIWDGRTGRLLASLDGHSDAVLAAAFVDGTRVVTSSRDGTTTVWDVELESRTPDAIRQIIRDRDPWTLSNGVLVPVGPTSGAPAAPTPLKPGPVTSNDDYATKLAALFGQFIDVLAETDCDELAANVRAFTDANRSQMDALVAWTAHHPIDDAAIMKAVAPAMSKLDHYAPVFDKCKDNQAFAAAKAAMKVLPP